VPLLVSKIWLFFILTQSGHCHNIFCLVLEFAHFVRNADKYVFIKKSITKFLPPYIVRKLTIIWFSLEGTRVRQFHGYLINRLSKSSKRNLSANQSRSHHSINHSLLLSEVC
jgi:hypothetical protein